jgi:hypothetical protein
MDDSPRKSMIVTLTHSDDLWLLADARRPTQPLPQAPARNRGDIRKTPLELQRTSLFKSLRLMGLQLSSCRKTAQFCNKKCVFTRDAKHGDSARLTLFQHLLSTDVRR